MACEPGKKNEEVSSGREREEGREEERELETVRKEVNESCINSVCNKQ